MRLRMLACAFALLLLPQLASAQVHVYVPGVRVSVAPPAMRVETRGPAPSPAHQWIAGSWAWRGGAHVWLGGHWVMPPSNGYHWSPGRWVNQGGQWTFFEGHWVPPVVTVAAPVVAAPPPSEVVVQMAPPEPIVETRPVAPQANYVWIPGYWHWHGQHHQWVAGYWSPPQIGYNWKGPLAALSERLAHGARPLAPLARP